MEGIWKHKDDTNQVACMPVIQMLFCQESKMCNNSFEYNHL